MTTEVRGYVLAGGRSSRMGENKSEMRLSGSTLLEIAVQKLRRVCREVVVVGEHAPTGVRVIRDLRPGCGPMGGIEAALRDIDRGSAAFLPVDMPFVPAELLERLVGEGVRCDAKIGLLVADGRVQPLVSLVRWDALSEVAAALEAGEYKVRPVLERAGRAAGGAVLLEIATRERRSVWPGWNPGDADWRMRELWFANLNTPEEFACAERLMEKRPPMVCRRAELHTTS